MRFMIVVKAIAHTMANESCAGHPPALQSQNLPTPRPHPCFECNARTLFPCEVNKLTQNTMDLDCSLSVPGNLCKHHIVMAVHLVLPGNTITTQTIFIQTPFWCVQPETLRAIFRAEDHKLQPLPSHGVQLSSTKTLQQGIINGQFQAVPSHQVWLSSAKALQQGIINGQFERVIFPAKIWTNQILALETM